MNAHLTRCKDRTPSQSSGAMRQSQKGSARCAIVRRSCNLPTGIPACPSAGQGAINLQPYQIARQRVFFASKTEFNKSIEVRKPEFGSVSSVAANNLPADRAGRTTEACRLNGGDAFRRQARV